MVELVAWGEVGEDFGDKFAEGGIFCVDDIEGWVGGGVGWEGEVSYHILGVILPEDEGLL